MTLRPRKRTLLILLLLFLTLAGGAAALVHRYGYETAPNLPILTEIKQSSEGEYPYSLAFIQFNDEGRFERKSQLENILRKIRAEAAESGAVIAMFVHGWNNTCNECSEEVQCFERQLAFISQIQSLRQPSRKVFGVYIGWKGVRLQPPEYNTALTFEDRRDVADRLGASGDLRETIDKLGAARKSLLRKSVLLVTGHSLGARAVFKAMTAGLREERNTLAALEQFSDLLVLFNPALSAVDYLAVDVEAARRAAGHSSERPTSGPEPPKMIVLGSESDYVTQMIYPFSVDRRWLIKLWKDEDLERFTTVGNFSSFFTHRLALTSGEPEMPAPANSVAACACTTTYGPRSTPKDTSFT